MSIFDAARKEHDNRTRDVDSDDEPDPGDPSASGAIQTARQAAVMVDGTPVPIEEPETTQTDDDAGSWLTGTKYGRPRGREAIEARRVSQTWPMELITNGIVDQLLGGELVFESDDDEVSGAEADLQALLRDIIMGPHLMDDDLDDLLAAAVADMMGPGNAYWQLLASADDALPVASLVPLDALTIRHNLNQHGVVPEDEPDYWQARNAFSSSGVASIGSVQPTPLERADLAVMRYPGNRRSYQIYPKSPSIQVLEALELLANSTTHHNRFYNDNEIPPGFIQVMNASSQTIGDIQDKIQAASGDPRSVEVIGGEGQAMWVEMGGTNVNLSVIEEQKWFLQLCLAAVGLGKAEIGMIEDVNRANGEVEQSRVFKRVTGPFAKQFEGAFRHIAQQFEVYNALNRPFDIRLRFSDPRAERAREERLRQMYLADGLTLRQYVSRRGDEDLADNDFEVEVGGQVIDYGDHPKFIVEHLLRDARADVPEDDQEDTEPDADDEEQAVRVGDGAGGAPHTNGDGQH